MTREIHNANEPEYKIHETKQINTTDVTKGNHEPAYGNKIVNQEQ